MDCTICHAPSTVFLTNLTDQRYTYLQYQYTLRQCSQCKLIFIAPQPSMAQLFEHYPDDYYVGYTKPVVAHSKRKQFLLHTIAKQYFGYGKPSALLKTILYPLYFKAPWLPTYVKNGRILDVGCGPGMRLNLFTSLGWQVEGIEPHEPSVQVARSQGYTVHHGVLDQTNLPEKHYNAIYLSHVFEHLPDPHVSLAKIGRLLNHGGELILIVPNSNSLGRKLLKQRWPMLDVPIHLYHFNAQNLRTLLSLHHFKIKHIYHNEFLQYSFLGFLGLYRWPEQSFTRKLSNHLALALSLLLSPWVQFLKISDCLVVRAQLCA